MARITVFRRGDSHFTFVCTTLIILTGRLYIRSKEDESKSAGRQRNTYNTYLSALLMPFIDADVISEMDGRLIPLYVVARKNGR
jgi:hypothetical protein